MRKNDQISSVPLRKGCLKLRLKSQDALLCMSVHKSTLGKLLTSSWSSICSFSFSISWLCWLISSSWLDKNMSLLNYLMLCPWFQTGKAQRKDIVTEMGLKGNQEKFYIGWRRDVYLIIKLLVEFADLLLILMPLLIRDPDDDGGVVIINGCLITSVRYHLLLITQLLCFWDILT